MSHTPFQKTDPSRDTRDLRFRDLKATLHEQLIDRVDFSVLRSVGPEVLREELRRGAIELCGTHADLLSGAERRRLVDELVDEALGLGPLEPLLQDPTVSDILINGPKQVYVEREGRLEETTVTFRDLDHLLEIVQRVAGRVGRRVDESSPMVDARLPDGSRLNAVVKPLALEGALVSIRRIATKQVSPTDFVKQGSASQAILVFLAACVVARLNIVISGGTGSGKTTLLNLLSTFISPDERIATIEDTAELRLRQSHVARMETRPANSSGKGEVSARDLLRNALRMRPDRIIVGECRGPEAFDMLQAINTGHDGGMSTIHANSARDALARLEMLVGMAAPELPMWLIHRQIASTIQIVVQVSRLTNGERKVVQVSEVVGVKEGAVEVQDLFRFQTQGPESKGAFVSCGVTPRCLPRLESRGLRISPDLFQQGAQPRDGSTTGAETCSM